MPASNGATMDRKSNGEWTYRTAVALGNYNSYASNLVGKHDNVRLYWEDQSTRLALLNPISELLDQRPRPIRVLDLGCGSGQGYENLTRLERDYLNLSEFHDWLLKEDELFYFGVDLSTAMVEQGRKNYSGYDNVRFEPADLNQGLGIAGEEEAFDIYYSSYGSLSHLERRNLVPLLSQIAKHGQNGSIAVLDLLGRYSLEWPCYWTAVTEEEKYRNYTMSYLFLDNPERMDEAEHFPIRFWSGDEIDPLVEEIYEITGVRYRVLVNMDRSILMGRHSDTATFNPLIQPVRAAVNKLLEDHMRTNLNELIVDPDIVPANTPVTKFYQQYIYCWNKLVEFTQRRAESAMRLTELKGWSQMPAALQFCLMSMDRVINDVNWMGFGDPRANIIEPQLAYALQSLERNLQQGLGCGHGLVVVLQVEK